MGLLLKIELIIQIFKNKKETKLGIKVLNRCQISTHFLRVPSFMPNRCGVPFSPTRYSYRIFGTWRSLGIETQTIFHVINYTFLDLIVINKTPLSNLFFGQIFHASVARGVALFMHQVLTSGAHSCLAGPWDVPIVSTTLATALLRKKAVSAFQISGKLLPFTLEDSWRN